MLKQTLAPGLLAIAAVMLVTACGDNDSVTLNAPVQQQPDPDPDPQPDPDPEPSASGDIFVVNALEAGPDATRNPVEINNLALQFSDDPSIYDDILSGS